jgi:hypothetical protein
MLFLMLAALNTVNMTSKSSSYATSQAKSKVPYLNLSIVLANKLHEFMMNSTSFAYFFSLSSNWKNVTTNQYSTLGNAMIVSGLIQLYEATSNSTYLIWASETAESFWTISLSKSFFGGFFETYNSDWSIATCDQALQDNAMFEIDFLNLAATNGSSVWLNRANSIESYLNNVFWSRQDRVVEEEYDACSGQLSGDSQIEVSIGSYLWATSAWTIATKNRTFAGRMESVASFAWDYLWDSSTNNLPAGPGCGGNGYSGFMRSVYSNKTSIDDCRKGANENIWGAMGLAYYSKVSRNQTVATWVVQDLSWLNKTFYDPSIGGYHEDAFRNDTLRSACAENNDPKDYPGWTEAEQPWLWYEIGHLLRNATMTNWAKVPLSWTATHQWNTTASNGGLMTCLDNNGMPDPGSTQLFDWIQGGALNAFSIVP